MWDMIQRCWEHRPLNRISMDDVLRMFEDWNRGWGLTTIKLIETSIAQWIFDNRGYHLCWIENSSSARSTHIASVIAELCSREGRLGASIFFARGLTPMDFFPKILDQIARHVSAAEPLIRSAIRQDPLILSPNSTDELQKLLLRTIIQPMSPLTGTIPPKVIVVDCLDLCEEASEIEGSWLTVEILVQAIVWLAESLHRDQVPLQIIVTSHPSLHRNAKRGLPKFKTEGRSLYLHEYGLLDSLTEGSCWWS